MDFYEKKFSTEKSVERAARLYRYAFTSPNPSKMILPILIISLALGFFLCPSTDAIILGLIIFALPSYLSAIISKPLAECLGGKLFFRRSFLLVFLSLLSIALILILTFILNLFIDFPIILSIIFAYSFTLWLRHTILVATSNSDHLLSLPASISQPMLGVAFVSLASLFHPIRLSNLDILFTGIFMSIFFIASVSYTEMASALIRRNFNYNGLDLVKYFLNQLTDKSLELEDFFKTFSERVDAHLGVVCFKIGDEIKAVVVVPSVHPGPFGNLGGSDLPAKIADGLRDYSANVLTFHGPATHDMNPSSSKECQRIIAGVRRCIESVKYTSKCSKFVRVDDGMQVCAQLFGNSVLLIHTSSPEPTDDVDYATGTTAIMTAKEKVKDALFADAHNCVELGSGTIFFGSGRSFKMLSLVKNAVSRAIENESEGIKVGYAHRDGFSIDDGIGKQGVQVLVVETGNQRSAYILWDGNNMVPKLRESILSAINEIVDEAEVLTTDNHAVNLAMDGYNPIGLHKSREEIIKITRGVVEEALSDLEECEVGMSTGIVKDLNVIGFGNTVRLTTVINSTVSLLKKATAVIIASAVLACLLLATLIL